MLFFDSILQSERLRLVVAEFPETFSGVPSAPRLFDLALQGILPDADPETDNRFPAQRFLFAWPGDPLDHKFHRLEAFLPFFIIPITDAQKLFAVLLRQLSDAALTGFER